MTAPTCITCGKAIAKKTVVLNFRATPGGNRSAYWRDIVADPLPRNRTEAQRLVNDLTIVSVRYCDAPVKSIAFSEGELTAVERSGERFVCAASGWDGESYADRFFCNGTCTTRYAYRCAWITHKEREKVKT